MNSFSKSLAIEYESKGILVQTVCPGQVRTNMTKEFSNYALEVSAEDYVWHALNTVGIESFTCGHWKHDLLKVIFVDIFKMLFGERLISKMMFSLLKHIRTIYYKKHLLSDKF
jgi:short-subunit dehydrogenase